MEAKSVLDVLKERGFVQQITDEENLPGILAGEKVAVYIGFDPTADSLHIGSLIPIMSLMHMQQHGHLPIVVLGGGTAMVGDPSGKTEMRKMLYRDQINIHGEMFKKQLNRYLHFDEGKAVAVNNVDWLIGLNYIDFLRDIGRHFSVNRMLTAEAYKIRLETGLSFLEFNYQLLQAYDFLMLYKQHACKLQMGGDDQWGNIVAGIDLIRRVEGGQAYGITFPLLQTATGQKMGKTVKGAIWLDGDKTSPFEFYQYWINVDDRDVKRFLAFFTLLPMDEVERLGALQGADIREAKKVLAFEATQITHGKREAIKAQEASNSAFGNCQYGLSGIPTTAFSKIELENGINVVDLLLKVNLVASKSDARRLIQQGGCYLNDARVESIELLINLSNLINETILLRAGKKKYHRITVS
ncbi:MAG: tyrosine--tRNA ligase [Candidatus Zhuqueibacterota bacterium]